MMELVKKKQGLWLGHVAFFVNHLTAYFCLGNLFSPHARVPISIIVGNHFTIFMYTIVNSNTSLLPIIQGQLLDVNRYVMRSLWVHLWINNGTPAYGWASLWHWWTKQKCMWLSCAWQTKPLWKRCKTHQFYIYLTASYLKKWLVNIK